MRLARFFIDRPVFAAVISIAITLVGAIAVFRLPISEYPEIAPPTVTITALYPGASAETIARMGLGRSYQKTNIFLPFTVWENVRLAAQAHTPHAARWFTRADSLTTVNRRAERALDLDRVGLAAERDQQRLHRALAAVGHGAQVGRHQTGPLEPTADRPGDLGGAERALERVGGDEDGALSHRRILSTCISQQSYIRPVRGDATRWSEAHATIE